MPRLVMLVQSARAAASRYRALAYVPHLERLGWEVEVVENDRSIAARLDLVRRARRSDLVFVQRKRLAGPLLRALKSGGAKLAFDVDDAVMLRSSRHVERESRTRQRRFASALAHADLVAAGNPHLSERIARSHPRVFVQPLAFEPDALERRSDYAAGVPFTLGWIGGAKSLSFLEGLGPALERLAQRRAGLRLAIVCSRAFSLEHMPVALRPWSAETEGAEVAAFDVALAPLPDDEWSRSKCGTKLLQGFAAAVPVVASPVGVHAQMLDGGRNGLAANSLEDWEAAIERLIGDAALRERLGLAGRRYLEMHHRADRLAEQLDARFRDALAGRWRA